MRAIFAAGWHTAVAVEEHRKLPIDKTRLTVLRGFLLKVWNNVIFGLQAEEACGMQGFGSRKRKSLRIGFIIHDFAARLPDEWRDADQLWSEACSNRSVWLSPSEFMVRACAAAVKSSHVQPLSG